MILFWTIFLSVQYKLREILANQLINSWSFMFFKFVFIVFDKISWTNYCFERNWKFVFPLFFYQKVYQHILKKYIFFQTRRVGKIWCSLSCFLNNKLSIIVELYPLLKTFHSIKFNSLRKFSSWLLIMDISLLCWVITTLIRVRWFEKVMLRYHELVLNSSKIPISIFFFNSKYPINIG